MLCCVIADLIALHYLPHSIMTEKLARRGLHVPGEYEANVLNSVRVDEVMRKDVVPIPSDMTVGELSARIGRGARQFSLSEGLPISSADGCWWAWSRRETCGARWKKIPLANHGRQGWWTQTNRCVQ